MNRVKQCEEVKMTPVLEMAFFQKKKKNKYNWNTISNLINNSSHKYYISRTRNFGLVLQMNLT